MQTIGLNSCAKIIQGIQNPVKFRVAQLGVNQEWADKQTRSYFSGEGVLIVLEKKIINVVAVGKFQCAF